jgi:PST family polysaccharide transporter
MFKNAKYLFFAQGANYLFPLIALPYLTRTLGIAGFGLYAFTQVVVQYAQVVTEYGFNLTATRKVATVRHDRKALTDVFWSVLLAKIALAAVVTGVGAIAVAVWVADLTMKLLWTYSLLGVWGSVLFPLWYFQGIESMKMIAWINVISKLAGLLVMIVLVQGTSDIHFAGLAQAIPSLIAGTLACWVIYTTKKIGSLRCADTCIFAELKDGRHLFVSSALSAVIANSGTFVLGLYHNPVTVGLYAAAERLVKAVVGCFGPITQAIYPGNARAFAQSQQDGFASVRRSASYVLPMAGVIAVLLWLFAPQIATIFDWNAAGQIRIIQLLAPWVFLGVLNNLLGIQTLAAMGAGQVYSRLFMYASSMAVLILVVGAQDYGINAVLASMTVAEGLLTLLLAAAVKNKWKAQ